MGAFGDRVADFAHLARKQIELRVRPADLNEDWQDQRTIELANDEDLFGKINRCVQFAQWHKLQGVGVGGDGIFTLYEWHGETWFASDPVLVEQGARENIRNWQNRVFATGGEYKLWLLERAKPRGVRRAGEAEAGGFQSEQRMASNLVALLGCM